jgi:hypothetical protein
MKRTDKEAEILEYALEVFKNTTGIDYRIDKEQAHDQDPRHDALIILKKDGTEYQYSVEIKTRINNQILGAIIDRMRRLPQDGLIITDYVNPNIAEKLKDMNVPFIDTAGNAYVKEPGLYVFIKGNKPGRIQNLNVARQAMLTITPRLFPPTILTAEPRGQAFQPAGLKVVFALLNNPEIVNAPYREIAKTADVALGTVGWVIRNLKEQRFLIENGKDKGRKRFRTLMDKTSLLDKWVEAYNEKLRPTLVVGRYDTAQDRWWDNIDINNYGACWGGEVAAARITGYLKPQVGTIYVDEMPAQLLMGFRMQYDPHGNAEILKKFWNEEINRKIRPDIAPLIVVYADLLATGDARNLETARLLYDNEIIGLIGQN